MNLMARPLLCALFTVAVLQGAGNGPLVQEVGPQEAGPVARVGQPAVDIAGTDATGRACALSDYKGQVILLDISTAWCYWCQVDAPAIQALYARHEAQGLKVVTVLSEDVNGAGPVSLGNLQSWVHTYGLTFRVMSDGSGASNGVAEKVYVSNPASGGFPTLVLIDKAFKVQYLMGGYDDNAIKAKLAALLAQ